MIRNKTDINGAQIPADKLESLALIQGINFAPNNTGDKLILVGTNNAGDYDQLEINL